MTASRLIAVLWWALLAAGAAAVAPGQSLPAFPGAEGFGAIATGGRGGEVYKVTTLAARGTGSLQWALDQPGPRIIVFEAEDATLVPLSALFRDGESWAVFSVVDGRAELREIEIGARDRRSAMVESGLEAGETVVLYPSEAITSGVLVTSRELE